MLILAEAIQIASKAHIGQLGLNGMPYIVHLIRIMNGLHTSDEELMAICILSDVVFHGNVTYSDLIKKRMTPRIIAGVRCLTADRGYDLNYFIESLKNNKDALLVEQERLRILLDITEYKSWQKIHYYDTLEKRSAAFKRVEELLKEFTNLEKNRGY